MANEVRVKGSWIAALVLAGTPVIAANPPPLPTDEDFLAYLGSWEGDDADWEVAQAAQQTVSPASAPASTRKEPARRVAAESAAPAAQERK